LPAARADPEKSGPEFEPVGRGLPETTTMTTEILYLTAQLQRWLNSQVARHLAKQAAKLAR
jgi:hypothetical protein